MLTRTKLEHILKNTDKRGSSLKLLEYAKNHNKPGLSYMSIDSNTGEEKLNYVRLGSEIPNLDTHVILGVVENPILIEAQLKIYLTSWDEISEQLDKIFIREEEI